MYIITRCVPCNRCSLLPLAAPATIHGCLTLESHQRKGEKAYVGALRATKTALRLIKREPSLRPIATDLLETGNQTRRENTSRKKDGEKAAAAPIASVKRDPGKIVRKVSFSNGSCFLLQNPSTAVRVSGPYSGKKKRGTLANSEKPL